LHQEDQAGTDEEPQNINHLYLPLVFGIQIYIILTDMPALFPEDSRRPDHPSAGPSWLGRGAMGMKMALMLRYW